MLDEPLAHCINPPTPEGEEIGFSIPEFPNPGGKESWVNGLTLEYKENVDEETSLN